MDSFGEGSASERGLQGCSICTAVAAAESAVCVLCGSKLHHGSDQSIQRTWALLLTSVVLYLPANLLPIMVTRFLGEDTSSTIMGGVVTLWHHESYPIALVIFVASVLVPVGKILAMGWLCLSVQRRSTFALSHKMTLYRVTEFVGRWSMVDVFVVAILVALIQLGNVMSVFPGVAALAFAAMVVTTMLAAMAFDPRLIWRSAERDKNL
jgi:paraquat-inducible protein A